MSNYIPTYQKKNRIFSKRERTLVGAIKRNEPDERLLILAEKLREAKVQVFRAGVGVSQTSIDKWQTLTPEAIVHHYRKKCEPSDAAEP